MAAVDQNTLLEEVKCYACLGLSIADLLKLALLSRIATGGGGSGNWQLTELGATAMPYSFNATTNTIIVFAALLQSAGGTPVVQIGQTGTALKLLSYSGAVQMRTVATVFARPGDTISLTDASSAPASTSISSLSIFEET